jgi:mono/diheme cytochrome c family protein
MLGMTKPAFKCLFLSFVFLFSSTPMAENYDSYALAEGGRIYDNWPLELGKEAPNSTHPGYNDYKGKKRGAETWRCKACHGWDYEGAMGAYGKGAHYTGTKGITAYRGATIDEVVAVLRNDNHAFDRVLTEEQLKKVAVFVGQGLLNMRAFIRLNGSKVSGDATKGRLTYQEQCTLCHGSSGKARNLSQSRSQKLYMGDVANDNPWKVMHKIRFGHPGKFYTNKYDEEGRPRMNMPAMLGVIPLEGQIDLLAYLMSLPTD